MYHMSKYTPGPWYVSRYKEIGRLFKASNGVEIFHKVAYAAKSTYVNGRYIKNKSVDANAALIAAAPELLEAHKELLQWYQSLAEPGLVPNSLHSLLRDIKKLVAKAEDRE